MDCPWYAQSHGIAGGVLGLWPAFYSSAAFLVSAGEGDGEGGQANLGVDAWQELTEGLVKRASEFQVLVALGDGETFGQTGYRDRSLRSKTSRIA